MMKSAIKPVSICIWMLFAAFGLHAQNTVSLSAGSVSLEFVQPAEAGAPVMQVTDNSKWLNYHSRIPVYSPPGTMYCVNVQLESALPAGLELNIVAGVFQGTWGGNWDSPNRRGTGYNSEAPELYRPGIATPGGVNLTLLPQILVGSIGNFDTGLGAYVGHQLTYTMSISDYSSVRAASSQQVSVLYTIMEQH